MLVYVHLFLRNLVFSCFVEAGAAGTCVSVARKGSWGQPATVAAIGTSLTIPYVWFVFPTLLYFSPLAIILVGESFAFLVEGFLYAYICKFSLRFALLVSFVANAASYLLGVFLW